MIKYGTDNIGFLRKVMLHCPEQSILRINENNFQFYLFEKVPEYDRFLGEHHAYKKLLIDNGIEVLELSNYILNNKDLMSYLPNLAYLNDTCVITNKGTVLSSMCPGGRQHENLVVKEAITSLGIPIVYECEPGDQFEGFMTLFPDTLFVADTQRHSKAAIERFFIFAQQYYSNIIYAEIPQARRFMHPDMIINKITDSLGLVFPPAFLRCWSIQNNKRQEIDFIAWARKRNLELIPVSDEEQQKWGTSFILLKPNHILNYDISLTSTTQKALESMGVKFTHFHPDALLAGGGSLRCLTLRVLIE